MPTQKLNLTDVSNLRNEQSATGTLASNNRAIEAAIEKTLSRDGTSPNQMSTDIDLNGNTLLNIDGLDMNSTRITGLLEAVSDDEPVRKSEFDDIASDITTIHNQVVLAQNAADAASVSAGSASDSADDAEAAQVAAEAAAAGVNLPPIQSGDAGKILFVKATEDGYELDDAPTGGASAAEDVTFTPAGNISSSDVQAAIEELDSEKAASSHTHAASAVTFTPAGNISSSDVQAAIEELDTEKSGTSHTHTAAATTFTPAGNISASDVQAAIQELDTEKSSTSHTHTAAATSFTPAGGIVATDVQDAIEELDTEKAALSGAAFSGNVSISGTFLMGATTQVSTEVDGVGVTPNVQIQANSAAASFGMFRYSADTAAPAIYFGKSRDSTTQGHSVLTTGDQLGRLSWAGSDGSAFAEAARLDVISEGTMATNSMGGTMRVRLSPQGSQQVRTVFQWTANGNTTVGPLAAVATNATDGFLYIPTCAGTPTGTPTSYTGKVAMIYDTTNNKLYIYNGAWKASAAFT